MHPRIAILLPTYNGGRYLAEQLDSLIAQSYADFVIVIRDDGSTDNTLLIIQSYQTRYPLIIHVLQSGQDRLGASGNFTHLMRYVLDNKNALGLDTAYMLFCDQDDVWMENKIELEMNSMLEAESDSALIPVLIHCDLHVVSQGRTSIAPSYIKYQGLKAERNRFAQLLISNLVTGCTVLVNEVLARRALPIPAAAIMHDWWLALVATAFGKVIFIDQCLVDYRQHESNTIGAREYIRPTSSGKSFSEKLALHNMTNPHLDQVAEQARAFYRQYADQLGVRNRISLRLSAAMFRQVGIVQKILYKFVLRL